jgi:hypothetical protein
MKSLPRTYVFYLPLRGLSSIGATEVTIAPDVAVIDTTGRKEIDGVPVLDPQLSETQTSMALPIGDLVATGGEEKAVLGGNSRYLRIRSNGYCTTTDLKQTASARAFSTAKQFLVFSLADGVLKDGYQSGRPPLFAQILEVGEDRLQGQIELPVSVIRQIDRYVWNENAIAESPTNALFGLGLLGMARGLSIADKDQTSERAARVERIQKRLERTAKVLAAAQDSEDAMALRAAAEWYFDSNAEENQTISFMQMCIGFEALFGTQREGESVRQTLADRLSFVTGKGRPARRDIAKKFGQLYQVRSTIVHGRTSRLSERDREFLRWGQVHLLEAIAAELRWA